MSENIASQLDAEAPEPTGAGALDTQTLPSTALVEFENGLAVLFGDHVPDGIEVIPFTFMDEMTRAAVSTTAGNAVGLGNIIAQGVNGFMQAQGLVRLAPQTLAALKTAAPMVKDGWNLGTLASGGKIAAQVRWLPATAASTASVVAAMGPALALMAIQIQLNQIANVAQHNVALTSKVLQVIRLEQWSAVTGFHNTIMGELAHARALGEVTERIYSEVRGYQGELSTQLETFEGAAQRHVVELRSKTGHKERQEYLADHGESIIADVQALLLTQSSWFVYQSLRAGHLLKSAKSNPQDAELLQNIVTNAQELHAKTLDETDWLLDQLAREFTIIAELSGKRTFKIGSTARAAKEAAHMVRQLRQALASVRGQLAPSEPEPLTLPSILVFETDVPDELARILPLRLHAGERVLALADVSCDRWKVPGLRSGWAAITNHRLLVTRQDSLRRVGGIDIDLDVDDIRYVRRPDRGAEAPIIDVITRDANLTLQFPAWSKDGASRRDAESFGELVASFMHLPTAEIPTPRHSALEARLDQQLDVLPA